MTEQKQPNLGDRCRMTRGSLSSMNEGAEGELVLRYRDRTAFVLATDDGERVLGFGVQLVEA